MGRMKLNPDQIPLIVPDSSWTVPKELPDLRRIEEKGIDTETNDEGLRSGRGPGWVYGAGYVCGVGVAWKEGKNIRKVYVPIRHPDTDNFPKENVARWLKDITAKGKIVFQNAPYDLGWMNVDLGVPVPEGRIDDIGCMAVMADEAVRATSAHPKPYSLNAIAHRCGVPEKDEQLLKEAGHAYGFAPQEIKGNIHRLPARFAGPYGEQDPASTLMCAHVLRPVLAAEGLMTAYQLEMDLVPMVHAMRKRGIRIDVPHCEAAIDQLIKRRDAALKRLTDLIGGRAVDMEDIRSHKWLWQTFSNTGVEYNDKDGKASFERDWMRQGYVGRYQQGKQGHWLPQLIAEAKQCDEAANKFLQGYILDFTHRGRVHAVVNQFKNEDGGTKTHRFSYSDPPIQQMPSRPEIFLKEWTLTEDIAKIIRGAFLPERGAKWFSPDYSQQEYRLIVHYAAKLRCSKADEAVEKYLRDPNTDFHNMVVDMTGLIRQRAKDCNFAKSYGAGKYKFAIMTGMELEEAEGVMSQYDEEMPFVKQLMTKCTKAADRRGYIVMLDGARMHFNMWEAAWLTKAERDRGFADHYPMNECPLEEARQRAATKGHPWFGARLKRAFTHKAGNGLIQGGAARMGKMAMREMWRMGVTPLLQMHDEFPCSISKEKDGRAVAAAMREVGKQFGALVPFRVDEEYGHNWATAKLPWKEAKFAS